MKETVNRGAPWSGLWEESEHGGTDGNEDRADAADAGLDQRLAQRRTSFMLFLNEVEQHDHVAHDDANQARDAENREKTHRHSGHPEARERADRAERNAGEYDERLD